MRSSIRAIGLGVLPALLVMAAPPPSADACSMSRSPWTDFKRLAAAPQPGGIQLRYWHTYPTAFVFEIVDADGRRFPAAVRSWRIPWDAWWHDVQTYSVLEPVERQPVSGIDRR